MKLPVNRPAPTSLLAPGDLARMTTYARRTVTSGSGSNIGTRPRPAAARALAQQGWGLSATATGAGAYSVLVWVVGAYVFSTWPDGSQDIAAIVELSTAFTILNGLWGVALGVDLLNALWVRQRSVVRVVGTLLAIALVVMAHLAISNMRLAAGG